MVLRGSLRFWASGRVRFFSCSRSCPSKNYYELLQLPTTASIKDIKLQFKQLLKKHHPDLNTHLSSEEKEANNNRFVAIVTAYDTLKDIKKKKAYDSELRQGASSSSSHPTSTPRSEWQNEYYGEAKYYSKSGTRYSASGYNTTSHRVHNFGDYANESAFSGRHKNYGDRFDVPHFNYNEHLSKHLKFEQRLINKLLSDEDRAAILNQLSKGGDISKLDEELVTKHLMRQIHHSYNRHNNKASFAPQSSTAGASAKNPYMYTAPADEESVVFKSALFIGGLGTIYMLYSTLT